MRLGNRLAVCGAALTITVSASSASASVTIGQIAPLPAASTCGAPSTDHLQPTVNSGTSYVVPGTGTITGWSHTATGGMGQTLTMKIFRKIAEPARYQVVAHDGPRPLTGGALNQFAVSIPVKPGDFLGLHRVATATACVFGAAGDTYWSRSPGLADGDAGDFSQSGPGFRTNISATFEPDNAFALGAIKRNRKKGTAKLEVQVPNPGELALSGNGVKVAADARSALSVATPGTVALPLKAKGKKRKRLNEVGKVKLGVNVTYTPTGGAASAQSLKVKLRKK